VGHFVEPEHDRAVTVEEAEGVPAKYGIEYVEVSSKTGVGLRDLFRRLALRCVKLNSRGQSTVPQVIGSSQLLWRGSRDGFRAEDFHRLCDGRAPTLTLISDLNGNIFGGFTPIAWESPLWWKSKSDPSGRSFIFTLKNPHNAPVKRFSLISRRTSTAIRVRPNFGPCFGESDIVISDCCHTEPSHTQGFGQTYENTSGIEGKLFFTGSETFRVKEIEVFELQDRLPMITSDFE
jgi:hypothetical protein